MTDIEVPFTDEDRTEALTGIAGAFAIAADAAVEWQAAGGDLDDLITALCVRGQGDPGMLALAALLYLAQVANLGPDDLVDLAADITKTVAALGGGS